MINIHCGILTSTISSIWPVWDWKVVIVSVTKIIRHLYTMLINIMYMLINTEFQWQCNIRIVVAPLYAIIFVSSNFQSIPIRKTTIKMSRIHINFPNDVHLTLFRQPTTHLVENFAWYSSKHVYYIYTVVYWIIGYHHILFNLHGA